MLAECIQYIKAHEKGDLRRTHQLRSGNKTLNDKAHQGLQHLRDYAIDLARAEIQSLITDLADSKHKTDQEIKNRKKENISDDLKDSTRAALTHSEESPTNNGKLSPAGRKWLKPSLSTGGKYSRTRT